METRLRLTTPDAEQIGKIYAYISSVPADENGFINDYAGAPREGFENVLRRMADHARGEGLPEGYVPETHYLLWEGDEIVGWFRLRHYLCDSLREGAGHIGYSVREGYRGRGLATEGLRLLLKEAEDVIPEPEAYLRVNKDNPASLKVQLKCGARIVADDGAHYLTRIPLRQSEGTPLMTTDRISFIRVTPELLDEYVTMVNDPYTGAMISGTGMNVTRDGELAWITEHRRKQSCLYSMIERATGRFIGNIELFDFTEDSAVFGICLTPAMQGKGFGTEAIRRICAYGFEERGLRTIRLNVFSFNPRAIRCYEKAGFVRTGARSMAEYGAPDTEEYTMELRRTRTEA